MTENNKTYQELQCRTQAKFDSLYDSFDESDQISVDGAWGHMTDHWKNYYYAGCGIERIVRLMSPIDIVRSYDNLVSKGAKINIDRLFEKLKSCPGATEGFYNLRYAWFLEHGISIDKVIERIFPNDDYYDDGRKYAFIMENYDDLLAKGAKKEEISKILFETWENAKLLCDFVNEYVNKGLDFKLLVKNVPGDDSEYWSELEDGLIGWCETLITRGASVEDIEEIIDLFDYDEFYHRMISLDFDVWNNLGVDCLKPERIKRYFDYVLKNDGVINEMDHYSGYYSDETKKKLIDYFFENVPVETIMEDYPDDFFTENCSDIKAFAKRFVDENGYKSDSKSIDWIYWIIHKDKEALDLKKVSECVLAIEDAKERGEELESFIKLGLDEKLFS